MYLCTYPRASKLAFSPTPNTQECFRLHPLFWRIIPDDISILSVELLALSGWGYTDFHASMNFAFWAFSEVRVMRILGSYHARLACTWPLAHADCRIRLA